MGVDKFAKVLDLKFKFPRLITYANHEIHVETIRGRKGEDTCQIDGEGKKGERHWLKGERGDNVWSEDTWLKDGEGEDMEIGEGLQHGGFGEGGETHIAQRGKMRE